MKTKTTANSRAPRIALVVPHIFMHRDVLPGVIFAPATLALDLAAGLQRQGADVTLFSPGPVDTPVRSITADLSYFEAELKGRDDTYLSLLKKHPFTFITLARQVQSELIAKAYTMANAGEFDIVHVYTNEEDTALPFAALCTRPVVFTHHDPFNFLVKYKNVFPKYRHLPWISMSLAQRAGMPADTNWAGNIYHGLSEPELHPLAEPAGDYLAYLGRIIQPKGVHLAVEAVLSYNAARPDRPLKLKIAGKHYAGHSKDSYWQEHIEPLIDGSVIQYVGFIDSAEEKREFLGNAAALIVPSLFDEPFGMVSIEALACGTPVIGLDSGAIPEIINRSNIGIVVKKMKANDGKVDESAIISAVAASFNRLDTLDRASCRGEYEARFTAERMCMQHLALYRSLIR